jgi:hypothetical protein
VDPTDEPRLMAGLIARWLTPRTALLVGVFALLLTVAEVPLDVASHDVSQGFLVIPFGIVGFVIARRQPRNPIGWILLAITVTLMLADDGGSYALLKYHLGHPGLPFGRLAVFFAAGWVGLIALLPLSIALFPDGRLPRQWRLVLWLYVADGVLFLGITGALDVTGVLARHITVDSSGELAVFNSASSNRWEALSVHVTLPIYVVLALLLVASQVVAYRHSTGDRRAQLKWLMAGGAIAVISLVLSLTLSSSGPAVIRTAANYGFVGVLALPVGLGVGILKYRLYEIDRLISRTLSYAIVTGLLVGVYVGMIALTTRLIPLSSSVGVAASTLAAVGLFTPVRRRVQHRVDRRFNRNRYDAEAMVATFTSRLRDAVQLETVRSDLLNVVNSAVEPSQVSLWIRPIGRV